MEAKAILFTLYILHFINELYFGYSRAFSITSPVLGLQNNHPALCGLGHLAVHTEYSGSCILRTPTDGFAKQNGRDAERAD